MIRLIPLNDLEAYKKQSRGRGEKVKSSPCILLIIPEDELRMKKMKFIEPIRKVTNTIVVALFALVVLVVSTQVFSRFVIHLSIRWADELSRFAFVWIVYIGGAITIRDGRNVCFDLFLEAQKGKRWKLMFSVVTLISLAFLVMMTILGALVCKAELTESSPIMRWPMAVVCMCIPIGGTLMVLEEICYYFEHKDDKDECKLATREEK